MTAKTLKSIKKTSAKAPKAAAVLKEKLLATRLSTWQTGSSLTAGCLVRARALGPWLWRW